MKEPSSAAHRRRTNGWLLHPVERIELLEMFPPTYPKAIAHHVTLSSGLDELSVPEATRGTIVGRIDDGAGVEALIVEIDGSTHRPDGGTYHITWSLGADRDARESNDAIASLGWQRLGKKRSIKLMPACWEREVSEAK